jgi:hypothetical protein
MLLVRHVMVVLPLLVGWVDVAHADPPSVGESDRERARQLFEEANQFGRRSDFRKAKSSLSAAWALVKSWDIAVNLGTAELKLGHYRDAAEHLAWGVREGSIRMGESNEAVVKSRALLAQAAMRVGTVKLGVDQPGATVLVDEQFVGKSPLLDPVYVEPGSHRISAHPSDPGAAPGEVPIEIGAGEIRDLMLKLSATSNGASSRGPSDTPIVATNRSGLKTRTIVAIGGGALTAIAAGIALTYTLKASSAQSDADGFKARIIPGNCDQASDLCNQLADAQANRTDANRIATPAWIAAGVVGAATLGTFLLWPKDSRGDASTTGGVFLQAGPTSIALHGSF